MAMVFQGQEIRSASAASLGSALIVDQDDQDLQYYTTALLLLGYDVHPVGNYAEAEGCLRRRSFDFVIVNQGSPAFEARVVVERALTQNRHTPVIVLTRTLNMACYLEAMQLGAVDYVEKPVTPAYLEKFLITHGPMRTLKTHG